jgi:hypothetical protein
VSNNDCSKKTLLENNQNNFLIYIYIHTRTYEISISHQCMIKKKYKLFHIMTGEKNRLFHQKSKDSNFLSL